MHPTEGIRYYHFDELGSTRLLTDANGAVTDRYAYDAYGSLLSHDRYTGSVDQPYQYVGQLGYYTHWMEPDFGLLQLGVRLYDPEVGRFTQRDRVQMEQEGCYGYAAGNPCWWIDPDGLRCRRIPRTKTSRTLIEDHILWPGKVFIFAQALPLGQVRLTCKFEWTRRKTYAISTWQVLMEQCTFLCFFWRDGKELGEIPGTRRRRTLQQDTPEGKTIETGGLSTDTPEKQKERCINAAGRGVPNPGPGDEWITY